MKQWYQKLNIYHKTGFWALSIGLVISISLIPLFFFNMMDIPLGIILGASFGALYYIIAGFNQKDNYDKKALRVDVLLLVLRLILFALILVGLSLLYYLADIKIFNVFSYTGAYLSTLLVYLLITRKEGKR